MKRVLLAVLGVALAINVAVGLKYGLTRPMESDAYYYLQIAKSLAAGKGYVLEDGFWGNAPTMTRSPAWPFAVSLALRVTPGLPPDLVMRGVALALNAAVAMIIAWLSWRLLSSRRAAIAAGLVYAVYPTALYLACTGGSETLFLALAGGGSVALLCGGNRRYVGFVLLGLSALARANFILWVLFAACALPAIGFPLVKERGVKRVAAIGVIGALLFLAPAVLWAVRSERLCGHFPVFSTLRGQTFYGGNNPVVAGNLEYWGYWVFPNNIPGEKPMLELAKTMSEYEVDAYYFGRGLEYWKAEWFSLPRLLLGKTIRAYIPVPWKPGWGAYAVAVFRAVLWIGAATGVVMMWARLGSVVRIHWTAMFLTNWVTILIFWGCARFAFAMEPFLIPFAAAGWAVMLRAPWNAGWSVFMIRLHHFGLNGFAFFLLQPRLRSDKWRPTPTATEAIRNLGARRRMAYAVLRDVFSKMDLCARCRPTCCCGAFGRDSVYDYIAGHENGIVPAGSWHYEIRPLRSLSFNWVSAGACSHYQLGKGCLLENDRRPLACVTWACPEVLRGLSPEDRRQLEGAKRDLIGLMWRYGFIALTGGERGMRPSSGDTVKSWSRPDLGP